MGFVLPLLRLLNLESFEKESSFEKFIFFFLSFFFYYFYVFISMKKFQVKNLTRKKNLKRKMIHLF